jgi:hypothetical protein
MIMKRMMRMAEHVARMGEKWVKDIDGKARRKETTRKARHRWVDNIKMDLS